MFVVFRADASVSIGSGHVMRCLTLADELTRQGHQCHFVCRNHKGHLGDLIVGKGHGLTLLPSMNVNILSADARGSDNYTQWLGVHWQEDARETLDVLTPWKPDWLVVDHYALDAEWEGMLLSAVQNIMVIDDLANRLHACTLLLDQNVLDLDSAERYRQLVGKDCTLLLGPKYALLQPEYAQLAESLPERDGVISRVLIFVGGSDPYHLTERYLNVLTAPEFNYLFVDVVIGKNHPAPANVERLVEARTNTRLYSGLSSLAALMVRADLMLGAGGSTNWERMCLGLNSVVTSVAMNQYEINLALARKELIEFLGPANILTDDAVSLVISNTLQDIRVNEKRSAAMRKVVDGRGTKYVIQNCLEKYDNGFTKT
jgi:UDP-2,4-diacetamido-2,4,6-trideoxy-beta-L-altropyranose hydrolase